MKIILFFPDRIFSIIIAGGFIEKVTDVEDSSMVEVLTKDIINKKLPNLPIGINSSSLVCHAGEILICGGSKNLQKCLQYDHGTWREHSLLNEKRWEHSAVTLKSATFIFGGYHSKTTFEYLPNDSAKWILGKNEIPGGFEEGCAISTKSEQKILLIGGKGNGKRILSFNVHDQTFELLNSQLNVERWGHGCAFIPNTNKIIITGGFDNSLLNYSEDGIDNCFLNSTEILDIENGNVTMASPMTTKRRHHGMGIVTLNGEDRLAVFGGFNGKSLDSVELYNTHTRKWETADFKLNEAKASSSFLTIKLGDITSKL